MALAKKETSYTLTYCPMALFIIGSVIAAIGIAFTLVTISTFYSLLTLEDSGNSWTSFFVLAFFAFLISAGGIYLLSIALWRFKNKMWYLKFRKTEILINLRHEDSARALPEEPYPILKIPVDQLRWIRTSLRPSRGDDGPDFFVELGVTEQLLQEALAMKRAEYDLLNKNKIHIPDPTIRLFEGDVIRIQLEANRWPKGMTDYWKENGYTVSSPYEIKDYLDFESAKNAPKQIF